MMPALDIVRRRWTLIAVVRLVALGFACIGLFPVFAWLIQGIMDDDLLEMRYYLGNLIMSAVMLVMALVGFLLSGPIVRLATPVRSEVRCPKCSYELLAPSERLCPECGMDVSSLWSSGGGMSEIAWRARVTENVTIVLRLVGLVMGIYSGLNLLWNAARGVSEPYGMLVRLTWPLLLVLSSAGLLFFGGAIARRLVPAKVNLSPSQGSAGGDDGLGEPSDEPNESRSAG